jgi:hypothetical protein
LGANCLQLNLILLSTLKGRFMQTIENAGARVGRISTARNRAVLPRPLWFIVVACFFVSGCSLQQERFSTSEEAAGALIAAAQAEQTDEVRRILGRGADDVLSSGDEVADRQARDRFLSAYEEKHSLVSEPDGSMTLQVGQDDWPLPIPIVQHWGSWRFDTRRGKEEILNRRIGRNELAVQQVCLAIIDVQREYVADDRNGDGVLEYSQKFISDPGQKNGLYWESGPGEPSSPLGPLVADAVEEGYGAAGQQHGKRRPYYGYYFKLLTSQGPNAPGGDHDYFKNGKMTEGFAVVAWPALYGNSGVMTFLVSHHGVVYQQNLGRRTERIASSMTKFDPDPLWEIQ